LRQIYLTKGIILKKKDLGEADRLLYIYTENLGMIMASGQSVRSEKSKLRPNLDLFVYGSFAIISLGEFWRLVDAREIVSFRICPDSSGEVKTFAEVAKLILRMVKGEERNEEVWRALKDAFEKLNGDSACGKLVRPRRVRNLTRRDCQVIHKPTEPVGNSSNLPGCLQPGRLVEFSAGGNRRDEDLKTLEIQTVANILKGLGYMDKTSFSSQKEAVKLINEAIKESML